MLYGVVVVNSVFKNEINMVFSVYIELVVIYYVCILLFIIYSK